MCGPELNALLIAVPPSTVEQESGPLTVAPNSPPSVSVNDGDEEPSVWDPDTFTVAPHAATTAVQPPVGLSIRSSVPHGETPRSVSNPTDIALTEFDEMATRAEEFPASVGTDPRHVATATSPEATGLSV